VRCSRLRPVSTLRYAGPVTFLEVAETVLRTARKPLTTAEITETALRRGLRRSRRSGGSSPRGRHQDAREDAHRDDERRPLRGGELYNKFKDAELDSTKLEGQVATLMADEDVTKKRGIYSYVLDGAEKHLNIRAFSPNQRREAYERQKGICPVCGNHFELEEMEADHITPWHEGGKTEAANCKMLCKEDNRRKGGV
jgi:HNH endonuclease/HB1, ASXL, restriction endonuclease HTH domain